ncbi:MAG: PEP-CTERM sorting domain-containing protein [Candidatus Marinimicrobia bacterium]|nr:PEP-CTERM sorting domain-containing protein [Candidatus Neomarinimicrobiota bacterium]
MKLKQRLGMTNRHLAVIGAAVLALLITSPTPASVIFEDTFSGTELDTSKWTHTAGKGTVSFTVGGDTLNMVSEYEVDAPDARIGTDFNADFNFYDQELSFELSDVVWNDTTPNNDHRHQRVFFWLADKQSYRDKMTSVGMLIERGYGNAASIEPRVTFGYYTSTTTSGWFYNTKLIDEQAAGFEAPDGLDLVRMTLSASSFTVRIEAGANSKEWTGSLTGLSESAWSDSPALLVGNFSATGAENETDNDFGSVTVTVIPEPSALALLGLSTLALMAVRRARRKI